MIFKYFYNKKIKNIISKNKYKKFSILLKFLKIFYISKIIIKKNFDCCLKNYNYGKL